MPTDESKKNALATLAVAGGKAFIGHQLEKFRGTAGEEILDRAMADVREHHARADAEGREITDDERVSVARRFVADLLSGE